MWKCWTVYKCCDYSFFYCSQLQDKGSEGKTNYCTEAENRLETAPPSRFYRHRYRQPYQSKIVRKEHPFRLLTQTRTQIYTWKDYALNVGKQHGMHFNLQVHTQSMCCVNCIDNKREQYFSFAFIFVTYFCHLVPPASECNSIVVNVDSCTCVFVVFILFMIKN